MKKKFVIPLSMFSLMIMLACSVGYEGVSFGDDQPLLPPVLEEEVEAAPEAVDNPEPEAASAEPADHPVIPSSANAESAAAGSHEYSVTADNFDCICQATDNMTVDIKFTGDQVEVTNGGGGATQVYDKIAENKYQKTEMGYYILTDGVGDAATQTKVEQEDITVISFTDTGYMMESFKGDAGSACCTYTFTIER